MNWCGAAPACSLMSVWVHCINKSGRLFTFIYMHLYAYASYNICMHTADLSVSAHTVNKRNTWSRTLPPSRIRALRATADNGFGCTSARILSTIKLPSFPSSCAELGPMPARSTRTQQLTPETLDIQSCMIFLNPKQIGHRRSLGVISNIFERMVA